MTISIRSALLLLTLSVVVPAALAALWLILQTYRAERDATERHLRETTRALSSAVDRALDQRAQIARVLSAARALDEGLPLTPQRRREFEDDARAALGDLPGWVALDAADRHLVDTRWPPNSEPRPRSAQAPPLLDRVTLGALATDADDPAQTLRAAVTQPVVRGGQVLFNITLSILPAEVQGIVMRQPLPAGWVGSVLDAQGRLVARHPAGAAVVGRTASADLLATVTRRREGVFHRISLDDQPVSAFFSSSPQGWIYITAMPRAQFDGHMLLAVWRVTLGALVLLLAAVGGALYVARGIARPVQTIKAAAERMRAGQPVQALPTGIEECDAVKAALASAARSLRQAQVELEAEVAQAIERTRSAEQRMARSERDESLGRLTSGVAHDVNNLLGVISNSAHLMRRKVDDDGVRAHLASMLRAVDRGSQLTQHLLRFAGGHRDRIATVDLARQLGDLQDLMRVVLGRRIELTVSVAPGTALVTVDAAELELSLINLTLNARDALPAGGHVWLEARNADADEWAPLTGAGVMISLSDDGVGMDEQVAARAFEPFFTTKSAGRRTGLGLSQVQGFCQQAGGHARLASTPGLGTSVLLLLPAATPGRLTAARAPGQPAPALPLQGVRLLLVEDNDELATVSAALLASYGCRVQHARSAAQALDLVLRERPDIVLSDIVMPGDLDGLDLAQQLRAQCPRLPVVLITGYSRAVATDPPFTVLRKPCPPDILVAALVDALADSTIDPP